MINDRSNKFASALKTILSVGLLVGFGWYLYEIRATILTAVQSFDSATLVLISISIFLAWSARTWRDVIIYRSLNYRLEFWQVLEINNTRLALNHLPLRAGTVFAAWTYKTSHGIRLTDFASAFIAQAILVILASCIIGVISLMFHPLGSSSSGLLAISFLVCCFFIVIAGLFIRVPTWVILPERLRKLVDKVQMGMKTLRQSPGLLLVSLLLNIFSFVMAAWRMYLIYQVLAIDLSLAESLIIATAIQISVLVSITPASLGIREGLVGLMSAVLELSAGAGVAVASLDRVIILFWVFIISMVSFVRAKLLLGRSQNSD